MWAPGAYVEPGRITLPAPNIGVEGYFFDAADTVLARIKEYRQTGGRTPAHWSYRRRSLLGGRQQRRRPLVPQGNHLLQFRGGLLGSTRRPPARGKPMSASSRTSQARAGTRPSSSPSATSAFSSRALAVLERPHGTSRGGSSPPPDDIVALRTPINVPLQDGQRAVAVIWYTTDGSTPSAGVDAVPGPRSATARPGVSRFDHTTPTLAVARSRHQGQPGPRGFLRSSSVETDAPTTTATLSSGGCRTARAAGTSSPVTVTPDGERRL